jgi:probable HAF family extracellular repeat protein
MHKRMSCHRCTVVAWAVCFVVAGAFPFSVVAGSFEGLGELPGGFVGSDAEGVSADGLVVVGRSHSALGPQAFRWSSGGGMVGLGFLPGGTFSDAYGVSADGSVVVGMAFTAPGREAFGWTEGGGIVGLGYLQAGGVESEATAVSADGSVVVGFSDTEPFQPEAFRWTSGGGMVSLGQLPGGIASGAFALSNDASVVVGVSFDGWTYEAFRWTSGGGMVGLGHLAGGSLDSRAYGVSADGSVVVGHSDTATASAEAFRWTAGGGMVGLGHLAGGSYSEARAVSADGSVVVGFSDTASGYRAFVWDATNGMRDLRDVLVNDYGLVLSGWTLSRALGVSADGVTVVGRGTNPSSDTEAWVATLGPPIPVPATSVWGLAIAGVAAVAGAAVAVLARSDKRRGYLRH